MTPTSTTTTPRFRIRFQCSRMSLVTCMVRNRTKKKNYVDVDTWRWRGDVYFSFSTMFSRHLFWFSLFFFRFEFFEWVFGCRHKLAYIYTNVVEIDVRFWLISVEFCFASLAFDHSVVKPYVTSQRWTGETFSAENGWMWHTQNDSVKPMQNNKWNYFVQVINFIVSFGLFTYPRNSRWFFGACCLVGLLRSRTPKSMFRFRELNFRWLSSSFAFWNFGQLPARVSCKTFILWDEINKFSFYVFFISLSAMHIAANVRETFTFCCFHIFRG